MLQETFPEWFGPNPLVQIKDVEVISKKHDVAVVITENRALFQGLSPFLYSSQARIGVEVGTHHFPAFPPLKLGQLYSEGVISGRTNEHDWLATLAGINNGSSGAPLFFKKDPQQLAGMVLSKISSSNGATTGLANILTAETIAELIENYLAAQRKGYHD
jgi:S1-C subfamily serine protease